MNEYRRYHALIEQKVDIFIECCDNYIKKHYKNLKVWVIKDEQASMVGIGDPDKLFHSKDFGFIIPYETVIQNHDEAVNEFIFKLDHFIKVAKTTNKFKIFNDDSQQSETS